MFLPAYYASASYLTGKTVLITGEGDNSWISNNKAFEILEDLDYIKESLAYEYDRSDIYNKLYLFRSPTEEDPYFYISLAQKHMGSNTYMLIEYFKIDATSGEIQAQDRVKDVWLSLSDWEELRSMK